MKLEEDVDACHRSETSNELQDDCHQMDLEIKAVQSVKLEDASVTQQDSTGKLKS